MSFCVHPGAGSQRGSDRSYEEIDRETKENALANELNSNVSSAIRSSGRLLVFFHRYIAQQESPSPSNPFLSDCNVRILARLSSRTIVI